MSPSIDIVCKYRHTRTFLLPSPFLHIWECATHTAPFLAFLLNNLFWLSLHISTRRGGLIPPHICLSSPLTEDIYVVSDFLLYRLLPMPGVEWLDQRVGASVV